ncbi:MAG: SRPBCC domain-containing protein, partial [Sporichthyaceae bacterium]|nr:SRPBCC domain-containing protein [Sporichthyaceae bacterium]
MAVAGDHIEHEIHVQAPPEIVFSYFTDPDRHRRWLGRTATLDPRPGGIYQVEMNDNATVSGHFNLVDPPSRLQFTWGFLGNDAIPPGSSTVSITLTPSQGGTLLRLKHTGLPHPALTPHDHGWAGYLADLAALS